MYDYEIKDLREQSKAELLATLDLDGVTDMVKVGVLAELARRDS